MTTTAYTEEEFTKALTEAVAPIKAEADAKISELETELAALKSEKADGEVAGQIADIQVKLDEAELRASVAEADLKDTIDFLTSVEAEKLAEAEAAAHREEVRAIISEATAFGEDYIEENLDRWASMAEEEFALVLDTYRESMKVLKAEADSAKDKASEEPVSADTASAISNVRDEASTRSNASFVYSSRNAGLDVRKLAL